MPSLESETVKNGAIEDDSDFTDDDDSEEESMDDTEPTTCLFCTEVLKSVDLALEHITKQHGINFSQMKTKFNMDQYSFIKLINYIRQEEGVTVDKLNSATEAYWNDEKYLKPKDYEPWLTYGKCFEVILLLQLIGIFNYRLRGPAIRGSI